MPRRKVDRKSREELEEIQRLLRKYAKHPTWDRIIRSELAKLEKPAMAAVQRKIRAIPSRTKRHIRGGRDLRAEMITALKWNVDTTRDYTGAFLFLDAYSMPHGRENLPAYMEGIRYYTRWRSPIFGDMDRWKTQPKHPYFYRTLRPYELKVAKAAEQVINTIVKDIEG